MDEKNAANTQAWMPETYSGGGLRAEIGQQIETCEKQALPQTLRQKLVARLKRKADEMQRLQTAIALLGEGIS